MSGPLVIGPRSVTAGTVLQYSSLPPDTVAIYIQNYSKLTLLVSFGVSQPTATDSLNNQYDSVLAPGGRDVFYVQARGASIAERRLNAVGAFTGNVWLMPVDRTTAQANTGTTSQMNDVWLSAYGPYDPLPPFPGGMPLNIDISSQPRVVGLPMCTRALDGNSFNQAFPGAGVNSELFLNSLTGLIVPGHTIRVNIYLYSFSICTTANAAGAGGVVQTLLGDVRTAGGVSVGTVGQFSWPSPAVATWGLSWPAAGGPYPNYQLQLPFPIVFTLDLQSGKNIDHFSLLVHTSNVAGALPANIACNLAFAVDTRNVLTDPAAGLFQVPGPIGRPDDVLGLF